MRGSGLKAAAFANVEKSPSPPRTAAATPSPRSPAPGHIRARGGAAAPRGAGRLRPAPPPSPALRPAGPPWEEGRRQLREPAPAGEIMHSSGLGSGPKLGEKSIYRLSRPAGLRLSLETPDLEPGEAPTWLRIQLPLVALGKERNLDFYFFDLVTRMDSTLKKTETVLQDFLSRISFNA